MTRVERAAQTISHSTPMSLALALVLLGAAFWLGGWTRRISENESNISTIQNAMDRISQAVESNSRSIDRLTLIYEQQAVLIRELKDRRP